MTPSTDSDFAADSGADGNTDADVRRAVDDEAGRLAADDRRIHVAVARARRPAAAPATPVPLQAPWCVDIAVRNGVELLDVAGPAEVLATP
ncbi:MAG: hypothetical protein EA352_06720 [Gemmatimonadales bacterium]|nr:MAG: hypothetical protein EA352_06720 [Gemmatimonadales bacterium]